MTIQVDDTFRKLWESGTPTSAMAEKYGVEFRSINRAAKRAGLPSRKQQSAAVKFRSCKECGKPIHKDSTSGYCRFHFSRNIIAKKQANVRRPGDITLPKEPWGVEV